MNKNELYRIFHKREKQVETAKNKRAIITIGAFTLVYFLIFCLDKKPTGLDVIGDIISAFFIASLHFGINATIFQQLFSRSEAERKELEEIKKRISELEKQERNNN